MPRRQSGLRNFGSKTIFEISASVSPDWRGMPNLVGKSEWMRAMYSTSIEKLISGWVASHAEVNLAKRYLEVTLTNIFQDIDMLPTVNYNVNALPMRRIGQH